MRWLDSPASETQITHRARLWLYALAALVLAFLIVPTLIVVPMSLSDSQYLEFPPRAWSLRWYRLARVAMSPGSSRGTTPSCISRPTWADGRTTRGRCRVICTTTCFARSPIMRSRRCTCE